MLSDVHVLHFLDQTSKLALKRPPMQMFSCGFKWRYELAVQNSLV